MVKAPLEGCLKRVQVQRENAVITTDFSYAITGQLFVDVTIALPLADTLPCTVR